MLSIGAGSLSNNTTLPFINGNLSMVIMTVKMIFYVVCVGLLAILENLVGDLKRFEFFLKVILATITRPTPLLAVVIAIA